MWKLAYKDLYLQRKRLLFLLVTAGLIMGILFSVNNMGFLPTIFIFAFVGTYSFTIQTCFYEDKNNTLSFIRALPVSAGKIVAGRFLALAIVTTGALLIGFAALLIFQLATTTGFNWFRISVYALFAGLMSLSFNCLVAFIYYRWGYAKMQYVYAVTFMTLFIGGMIVGNFFPDLPGILANTSSLQILTSALLLSAIVMLALWYGSVKALNKLEFN